MAGFAAVYLLVHIVLAYNAPASGKLGYSLGSTESQDFVLLTAGEKQTVELTFFSIDRFEDFTVAIESQDKHFFVVEGNTSFPITMEAYQDTSLANETDLMNNHTVSFVLKGVFIGISKLTFKVGGLNTDGNLDPLTVKVRRQPTILDSILTYTLTVAIFLSYISMGVKMNWDEIWKRLRRPWGVIIGTVSQFILMPLIGFALANIANLDNVAAVGLIVIASCPGGYASNIIAIMFGCDIVLSVTMTAVSSFLALGMMPLNLFLYGRQFTQGTDSLVTPYVNIVISLALLIIPILLGILIYYKFPKVSKILNKVLRPFVVLIAILTAGFGIPVFIWAFDAPAEIYLVSIVLPPIGATFGVIAAKIACLDNRSAITISIETAFQNALLGLALAQISYPQPEADLIARGPVLYFIFSLLEGSIIAGITALMKRFPGKPLSDDVDCHDNDVCLDDVKDEKI